MRPAAGEEEEEEEEEFIRNRTRAGRDKEEEVEEELARNREGRVWCCPSLLIRWSFSSAWEPAPIRALARNQAIPNAEGQTRCHAAPALNPGSRRNPDTGRPVSARHALAVVTLTPVMRECRAPTATTDVDRGETKAMSQAQSPAS